MEAVILKSVDRNYRLGSVAVPALRNIDLQIRANCFTVISGPSGSGKTTLLNLIGCIDRPDRGEVRVDGQPLKKMSDDALSDFRGKNVGFVFQNFNLLPVLSAYENVEFPLLQLPRDQRRRRAFALLDAVGLADRATHRPDQLSGGQQQRVAIARALASEPKIVLADEPTANLDSETAGSIIELMRRMQRELRISFIFSSHDPQIVTTADDVVQLRDGRIHEITRERGLAAQARQ